MRSWRYNLTWCVGIETTVKMC
uniref:Uncharacterized protein n=1 Tax=Arundo donax TaxID=35708 RepID=A0A0A9CEW3_ARUDO